MKYFSYRDIVYYANGLYKRKFMQINALYVASFEPYAGSLMISMGLMEILKRRYARVAFFRPIIRDRNVDDNDTQFMREHFDLDLSYESCIGMDVAQVQTLLANNQEEKIYETLIGKFRRLQSTHDFVLCEGLSRTFFASTAGGDVNLQIAENLGTALISVINAKDKSISEVEEEMFRGAKLVKSHGLFHFASFVNRLSSHVKEVMLCRECDASTPYYFLLENQELNLPTVDMVKEALACDYVLGNVEDLQRVIHQSKIAAMNLENFLHIFEEGDFLIVPGDRSELIVGAIIANYSSQYPSISGILLTGGLVLSEGIQRLISGMNHYNIPILKVDTDTYTTAMNVAKVKAKIRATSTRKIALALGLFRESVDVKNIEALLSSSKKSVISPAMFQFSLLEKARKKIQRIVLPESSDERILRATEILLRRGVVQPILLGVEKEIKQLSNTLGINLEGVEIIDPKRSSKCGLYVNAFYELRKAKGLALDAAEDALTHHNYFATMMVHLGDADGMVSGAIHTTGDTIRPALQIIKTKPNNSLVSSLFFMSMKTEVLVYADCAINQDPDAQNLAEIAITSADTAAGFGLEIRVAMLSYSTGSSGFGQDVDKVRSATELVKQKRPDIIVEGPIQYDAAVDIDVAKTKLPNSKVAGRATIFIFPDLNTGNNTYKAVQRTSGAVAIGPVLQGLNKPINDLSRGCSVADIVNTVAITAIQAQSETE